MTAQQWDWPKDWPTREWKCLKPGFYSLGYGGRDLKITKKRGSNSWEKLYTAWIDGIAIAKSSSLPDAKSRAIRVVDQGKPLVPLDADEIETAEPWPAAVESWSEMAEPTPSLPEEPRNGTDPGSLRDILRQTEFEVQTIQSQRESSGSLYFTISGKLDISALSTLEGIVQLLRESGAVTCSVTLPSRISL